MSICVDVRSRRWFRCWAKWLSRRRGEWKNWWNNTRLCPLRPRLPPKTAFFASRSSISSIWTRISSWLHFFCFPLFDLKFNNRLDIYTHFSWQTFSVVKFNKKTVCPFFGSIKNHNLGLYSFCRYLFCVNFLTFEWMLENTSIPSPQTCTIRIEII